MYKIMQRSQFAYTAIKYGQSIFDFRLTESIQDTSPRIHPSRNKKPVSDKGASEFIRGVNASIENLKSKI
ncbi:hypothetical protein E5S67_05798 [Microcoleus sp. IPMA8]|uniref:Uncharacterized protein n=1 Tax=Microcoleus asticus IPMA8 TaxID=2563858 RepID=A0ABX2D624_9CYAN|nr:hypothetical protein [Microcoleus asticus IPMA8]